MPTSPATDVSDANDLRRTQAGFVLVEVMMAMVIFALLAALALPLIAPQRGGAVLRAKTAETVALLRAARDASLQTGRTVAAQASGDRRLQAGSRVMDLPPNLSVEMRAPGGDAILFFGDGRSSGGDIVLRAAKAASRIEVSAHTATVSVVAP